VVDVLYARDTHKFRDCFHSILGLRKAVAYLVLEFGDWEENLAISRSLCEEGLNERADKAALVICSDVGVEVCQELGLEVGKVEPAVVIRVGFVNQVHHQFIWLDLSNKSVAQTAAHLGHLVVTCTEFVKMHFGKWVGSYMAYLLLLQVDANRIRLGKVPGCVNYCDLTVLINLIDLLRDST
jgi:uncharacterized protein (DUF486 family)